MVTAIQCFGLGGLAVLAASAVWDSMTYRRAVRELLHKVEHLDHADCRALAAIGPDHLLDGGSSK